MIGDKQMATFVYIHGFNSAFTTANPKVAALATIGTVVGVTYDTLNTHDGCLDEIIAQLPADLTDVILVGTSLGGYYAATVAAMLGLPSVLINPSTIPGVSLSKYRGQSHTNYLTGHIGFFGKNTFSTYLGARIRPNPRCLPLVAVDLADAVIPSGDTVDYFKAYGVMVNTFDGGSHQFDHMTDFLPMIAAYANHVTYLP